MPIASIKPFRSLSPSKRRRVLPSVMELEDRRLLTLLGQSLFPANNPWNQNISAAPVAANSTTVMNRIISLYGNGKVHPDFAQDTGTHTQLYGIPYNVAHGNTKPSVSVVIGAYASESDLIPAPIPANAVLEGDFQDGPNAGLGNRGDSHLIVYDVDNNIAYEFYQASRPSENADGKWHADAEAVWNMNTNTFRTLGNTSADAAGLSILAGLVRPDEALPVSQGGQGVIDHAIRMTLPSAMILNQYIYPASHAANPGTNPTNQVPLGTRFRLKASFDISTLNPEAQVIAQAMKTYGLVLADTGGAFFVTGASAAVDTANNVSLTWNDSDVQDRLHGLKSIPESAFEVVSLKPTITGLSATSGVAGSTMTIIGQNFSGAAGQLQVLFGSVASPSVSVVDDSHLTVVVPAGAGMVDIRVQSGITTAPSTRNATSPIFGYGISAVTLADRFTYGGSVANDQLLFVAPTTAVAGTSFSLTVSAKTASGVTDSSYRGAIHFAATDVQAGLPANYTFTAADAGVHTFTVMLKSSGVQSVSATDLANGAVYGGASGINVSPDVARTLALTGFASGVAGVARSFTVTARDAYGNIATTFRDPVSFSSTNWQNTVPAPYTFTAADAGTHTFSARLIIAGTGKTLGVYDTKVWKTTGAESGITVNPAAMAKFLVMRPSVSAVVGGSIPIVVTAVDTFGNTIPTYTGTVRLTSGDKQATLPANYTYTTADAGVHTFAITFGTAVTLNITATDVATPTLTGMAWMVATAGTATSLVITGLTTTLTAGVTQTITVTAKDAFGNKATGYTGPVHFVSSDALAILPPDYLFTTADAGSHTFHVTFNTSGLDTISLSDLTDPTILGMVTNVRAS
jgi:hypothetical protein